MREEGFRCGSSVGRGHIVAYRTLAITIRDVLDDREVRRSNGLLS